jgi:methionyl-tRNA formyltransferase
MKYILVTEKKWHKELFESLLDYKEEVRWILIDKKVDFTKAKLETINPKKIFIPHWSYIIPEEIFLNFECIVFHMTDLPFGRGGSPLQNLIVRDIQKTKISALRVEKGIDTGKIYLKKELDLYGTAEEIFIRATKIIFSMIKEIIETNPEPYFQEGKSTTFRRRNLEDGDISELKDLEKIYDYIRMLDAEGYPNAYLEIDNFRLEFSRANFKTHEILADVRIIKK